MSTSRLELDEILKNLHIRFEELISCKLIERSEISKSCGEICASNSGVYLFWNWSRPMYVGRSDNLITRLQIHGRKGSSANSAAFACILAKEKFFKRRHREYQFSSMRDLWQNEEFRNLKIGTIKSERDFQRFFVEAKQGVQKMRVQVVEITNPCEQAIFEVYAHLRLCTPYNTFVNH